MCGQAGSGRSLHLPSLLCGRPVLVVSQGGSGLLGVGVAPDCQLRLESRLLHLLELGEADRRAALRPAVGRRRHPQPGHRPHEALQHAGPPSIFVENPPAQPRACADVCATTSAAASAAVPPCPPPPPPPIRPLGRPRRTALRAPLATLAPASATISATASSTSSTRAMGRAPPPLQPLLPPPPLPLLHLLLRYRLQC